MEEIMQICREALENEGYQVVNYSEVYERFRVKTASGEEIKVEFVED